MKSWANDLFPLEGRSPSDFHAFPGHFLGISWDWLASVSKHDSAAGHLVRDLNAAEIDRCGSVIYLCGSRRFLTQILQKNRVIRDFYGQSYLYGQLLTRLRPKKEDREGKIKIHGAHFNQRLPTEIEIISDRTTKSTTYLVE
jgi:hypothetical protein